MDVVEEDDEDAEDAEVQFVGKTSNTAVVVNAERLKTNKGELNAIDVIYSGIRKVLQKQR